MEKSTGSALGWRACAWALLLGLLPGCASELDTGRTSVDSGTFGTTVLTLVCKRMAYQDELAAGSDRVDVRGDRYRAICRQGLAAPADAPPDLKVLQRERPRLIEAIDGVWPAAFLGDLQAYATSPAFLSAYDDGTILAGVDALRDILRLGAPRAEVTDTLARLARRRGYAPARAGALHSLLTYPGLRDVLVHVPGDLAPGGSAHDAVTLLAAGAAVELRDLEAGAAAPDSDAVLALALLMGERDVLGTGTPTLLVERDARGLATIAPLAPGVLPPPYVDLDGDGLADIDGGDRFVDATGAVIPTPTPFPPSAGDDGGDGARDALGRPLEPWSRLPLYRYIDLDRTLLAAFLREGAALVDPGTGPGAQATALDLVRGAGALMGPRQTVQRTYDNGETLQYDGFDTEQSALLDMAHGYLQILRAPVIDDALVLARGMLRDHEPVLARLAEALFDAADIAAQADGAALEPGSPLWDDLMPVLRRILEEPGLLEDLMLGLENPRVAELGAYFRDYMTYADQFTYDPATQEVVGSFATEVDRGAPGSGFNRSIMQRVLHMLADTNGAVLCNKDGVVITLGNIAEQYAACELLRIDNLAHFYVQSMAYARDAAGDFITEEDGSLRRKARMPFQWGNDTLEELATDDVLELLTTIEGFRNHPTPQALNRSLFLDPRPDFVDSMIDPPLSRYGQLIEEIHRGTLPGWELGDFYDAIQPVVQPFADHDAEQLFVDLLVVLHDHWPARDSADHQQTDPDAAGYAWASDIASYEPMIAEILGRGHLLTGLVESAPALNAITANGRPLATILREAGLYVIVPREGLAKRNGETSTTTADGRPVPVLSPWHILADAYALKRARIAAEGERARAWDRGISRAVDVLARGEQDEDGAWRFRNRRLRGEGLVLIDFLVARLAAHDAAGERDAWLDQALLARIEELATGPLAAGAMDLVDALSANPEGRRAVEGLLAHALDESRDAEAFRALVTAVADIAQLAVRDDRDMVPLAHLAGDVLEPERGWVDAMLAVGRSAGQADGNGALAQTLRNLVAPYQPDRTPLGDLADGIGEIYRARPFDELGAPFASDDYAAMLEGLATFLDQEKRGLRDFIAIIEGRRLP